MSDPIWQSGFAEGVKAEREDGLAMLARKRAVAAAIAGNDAASAESRDQARHWLRFIDVLSDDLRAGLHEGLAELMAQLDRLPEGGGA